MPIPNILSRVYLRNWMKYAIDTWQGYWLSFGVQCHSDLHMTSDLAVVILTFKLLSGLYMYRKPKGVGSFVVDILVLGCRFAL